MSAGKKENTRKGHFLFVVEKLNIPAKAAFCAFVNKTTAIGLMFTIHVLAIHPVPAAVGSR